MALAVISSLKGHKSSRLPPPRVKAIVSIEIFPLFGIKSFLPREIFILNKNLDALAALIIMEDYFNIKFDNNEKINTKTWLK